MWVKESLCRPKDKKVTTSWKRDITVVIPVCIRNFVLPAPYQQVDTLILSNGEGPLYLSHARVLRVPWRGHAQTRKEAFSYIKTKYVFFTVTSN